MAQGVLRLGQEIEVRPGIVAKDSQGRIKCTPIFSRIVSLFAEQNPLQYAVPGGLIGVGTTVDPTLTRADRLVGQVLGQVGALPSVFVELEVNFFLLRRLLGVRTQGEEKQGKVAKLTKAEVLMLNIGSMCTGARVVAVKNDLAKLQLTSPVCTSAGEKVALSRRVDKHCAWPAASVVCCACLHGSCAQGASLAGARSRRASKWRRPPPEPTRYCACACNDARGSYVEASRRGLTTNACTVREPPERSCARQQRLPRPLAAPHRAVPSSAQAAQQPPCPRQ